MIATDRFHRLARAARGGCQQSLGELLHSLQPYLLHVANDLLESGLRPKCGASDLVQETAFKAAVHFGDFRGASDQELRHWLTAILKNQLVDVERAYVRSEKRRLGAERSLETAPIRDLAETVPDTEASLAETREQVELLLQEIERLPATLREVVIWRYQDGLAFSEIARRLESSHETARRRWHEALETLTRRMAHPEASPDA